MKEEPFWSNPIHIISSKIKIHKIIEFLHSQHHFHAASHDARGPFVPDETVPMTCLKLYCRDREGFRRLWLLNLDASTFPNFPMSIPSLTMSIEPTSIAIFSDFDSDDDLL